MEEKYYRCFLNRIKSAIAWRINIFQSIFLTQIDKIQHRAKKQESILYAFYDLKVSPATFDIVTFLVLAELERRQRGCQNLHVVIVPGPKEGFRDDNFTSLDSENKHWRLRNILVPCCWLIPSCKKVTVCATRQEAMALQASLAKYVFPKRYTVRFPVDQYDYSHVSAVVSRGLALPSIRAPTQAFRYVEDWLKVNVGERKAITISLRECSYYQERNSNIKEWAAFARSLNPDIYHPVIIRDTEAAFKGTSPELIGLTIFKESSWNVELRAALYELSYLNLSVNQGSSILFMMNSRTRYIYFKLITPTCGATTEQHFRAIGIEPGSQLKIATPFQRLVWKDDYFEVIQKEFMEMCDKIEKCFRK